MSMAGLGMKLISVFTALCFFQSTLIAAPFGIDREVLETQHQPASEFYLSHLPGEILIPINLIGAVTRPGLYYVPRNTDIFRLIAAAGGLRADAAGEEITVKRRVDRQESVININFSESITSTNTVIMTLESEDVVNIPFKEPLVSQNSLTLLSVVTAIFSLIVSAVILQKTLE